VRLNEVLAGRFQLDSEQASGGMGRVYRGRDLRTGSLVAIKVLQLKAGDEVDRFSREAALLAQVSHPGIVRYLAHGATDDGHFLAMEWIDGETMKDRLVRDGLTIVESVEAARQVAEALSEMHSRGIIHRDIKPSNLMFAGGEVARVKVLDFGVARRTDDIIGLTRTGYMVGSPGYMAPEQARGDRAALDHRADLFALGCVLYECLTSRPPFFGDPVAVRAKVLLSDPPPARELNPDVSPRLGALTAQLLSKEQRRRPLDAAQLARQLAALREVPGARRRQSADDSDATSTAVLRPPRRAEAASPLNFLLAIGNESPSATHSTAQTALEQIAAAHGGRLEVVDGKWWMILFSGGSSNEERSAEAARCALEIRTKLPKAPMALIADRASALEPLIDRAVTAVTKESLAFLFSDALPSVRHTDGIRLDEATAGQLQHVFHVVRSPEGAYLQRANGGGDS
jgi:serine/threonine protein kinase